MMERLVRHGETIFGLTITALGLSAFGSIAYGFWLAWEPLGWIAGGVFLLIAVAGLTLWQRSRRKPDSD